MARLLCVVAAVTSLAAATVHAQDAAQRQAALILRILSYDRNLTQRASGRVTILVAFRQGTAPSEAERTRVANAINALGQRMTVARMRSRAVLHAYTSRAALVEAARSERAAAIYVCTGLDGALQDIVAAAREARLLSMTGAAGSVRGGLSVGLVESGSEVRLYVNLRAVEAEGARLDATVLRLAEVIR